MVGVKGQYWLCLKEESVWEVKNRFSLNVLLMLSWNALGLQRGIQAAWISWGGILWQTLIFEEVEAGGRWPNSQKCITHVWGGRESYSFFMEKRELQIIKGSHLITRKNSFVKHWGRGSPRFTSHFQVYTKKWSPFSYWFGVSWRACIINAGNVVVVVFFMMSLKQN